MYKKILAAIDEHLTSEISARYALHMAKATGSKLFLCHVTNRSADSPHLTLAEQASRRLFRRATEMEVEAESILVAGDITRKICEIVKSEHIDIAFLAVSARDFSMRRYEGTIAKKIAAALPCSVAFVNVVHPGKVHAKKILLPVKASIRQMRERSYFAAGIARAFGSSLFLFHCPEPSRKFLHGEVLLTPPELEQRLSRDISRFTEHLDSYDVGHEKRVIQGKPAKAIPIEAAAKRFDLVIMGESEQGVIRSLFLGNTVSGVMKTTPCNLIILRPRHENP